MIQTIELMEEDEPSGEHASHHEMNLLSEIMEGRTQATGHRRPLEAFRVYLNSWKVAELCFCLLLFVSGLLLELLSVGPRERPIPYQQLLSSGEYIVNQVYNNSFEGETISNVELLIYGIALPFISQMILGPCCSTKFSRHRTVCEYFAALGLTLFVTNGIKNYVGYLRPIFYDICVPDEDYQTCTSEEVEDARKSFPSGHASISFCGLALLSFYLEGRFGISKLRVPTITSSSIDVERTRPSQHTIFFARVASVLSKSPLLLAIYIAASRVVDNKHFPADVVGGSAIGFSIALWIHGIWEETTL